MCLGVPGRVTTVYDDRGVRMGKVDFGGVVKDVCLEYVPDVRVGEYTVVHVGFALARIDEASARETLESLRALGALDGELAEGGDALPDRVP
jgi:hydrogenase expression/formation protein HypC